jgi:hypothetical protein
MASLLNGINSLSSPPLAPPSLMNNNNNNNNQKLSQILVPTDRIRLHQNTNPNQNPIQIQNPNPNPRSTRRFEQTRMLQQSYNNNNNNNNNAQNPNLTNHNYNPNFNANQNQNPYQNPNPMMNRQPMYGYGQNMMNGQAMGSSMGPSMNGPAMGPSMNGPAMGPPMIQPTSLLQPSVHPSNGMFPNQNQNQIYRSSQGPSQGLSQAPYTMPLNNGWRPYSSTNGYIPHSLNQNNNMSRQYRHHLFDSSDIDSNSSVSDMSSFRMYSDRHDSYDSDDVSSRSSDDSENDSDYDPNFINNQSRRDGASFMNEYKTHQLKHKHKKKMRRVINQVVAQELKQLNCPDHLNDILQRKLCRALEKNNSKLLKEYDINKHNLKENYGLLLEQQREVNKARTKKELENWLETGTDGLNFVCNVLGTKAIRTDQLSTKLKEKLASGDFDYTLEKIEPKVANSFIKDPFAILGLQLIRTVVDAHKETVKKENAEIEEKELAYEQKQRIINAKVKMGKEHQQQQQQQQQSSTKEENENEKEEKKEDTSILQASKTYIPPSMSMTNTRENKQEQEQEQEQEQQKEQQNAQDKKRSFTKRSRILGNPQDASAINPSVNLQNMTQSLAKFAAPLMNQVNKLSENANDSNEEHQKKLKEIQSQMPQPKLF